MGTSYQSKTAVRGSGTCGASSFVLRCCGVRVRGEEAKKRNHSGTAPGNKVGRNQRMIWKTKKKKQLAYYGSMITAHRPDIMKGILKQSVLRRMCVRGV